MNKIAVLVRIIRKRIKESKLTLRIEENGKSEAKIDATDIERRFGSPNLRSDDVVGVEIDVDGDGNGTSGSLASEQTRIIDGDGSRKEFVAGVGFIVKSVGARGIHYLDGNQLVGDIVTTGGSKLGEESIDGEEQLHFGVGTLRTGGNIHKRRLPHRSRHGGTSLVVDGNLVGIGRSQSNLCLRRVRTKINAVDYAVLVDVKGATWINWSIKLGMGVLYGIHRSTTDGISTHILLDGTAGSVGLGFSGMAGGGLEGPGIGSRSLSRNAILHTIIVGIDGTTITANVAAFGWALVNTIGDAIVIRILGTAELGLVVGGRESVVGRRKDNGTRIMNRIGTVDGAVTVVDSIIDTILVAVEWASLVIDDSNTGESGVDRIILVGVGGGVAEIGLIGDQILVRIGTAEDVHVLLGIALELAFVGKEGGARIRGAARI